MENAEALKAQIKELIDGAATEKDLRLVYITVSSILNK